MGGQGSKEATWSKLYNHTGNPVELAKPAAACRVGHQNGLSVPMVYSAIDIMAKMLSRYNYKCNVAKL